VTAQDSELCLYSQIDHGKIGHSQDLYIKNHLYFQSRKYKNIIQNIAKIILYCDNGLFESSEIYEPCLQDCIPSASLNINVKEIGQHYLKCVIKPRPKNVLLLTKLKEMPQFQLQL